MRSLAPKAFLLAGVAAMSGLLAYWLVPRWGLDGAAMAACGAAAIELVGSAVLVVVAMRRFDGSAAPPGGVRGAADAAPGRRPG
jgi:O-antigen/teichoic acid export membrane protein